MHLSLSRCLAILFLMASAAPLAMAGHKKQSQPTDEVLQQNPEILRMLREIEISPEDAGLLNDLANLYARKGWNDLAINAYQRAAKLSPLSSLPWSNMGAVYFKMKELGQAEKALRKAISLEPRAARAHYNLGVVLDRRGRYDQALAEYHTAVTYEPDLLDPATNPQVVNNPHITVIRLMSYLDRSGSSSSSLEDAVPRTSPSSSLPDGSSGAGVVLPPSDSSAGTDGSGLGSISSSGPSPAGSGARDRDDILAGYSSLQASMAGSSARKILGSLVVNGRARGLKLVKIDPWRLTRSPRLL